MYIYRPKTNKLVITHGHHESLSRKRYKLVSIQVSWHDSKTCVDKSAWQSKQNNLTK